jgi:hypothetical protein
MNDFCLVGVIESPPVLLVDVALTGSVECRGDRAAAVAAADDLGGEMINRHLPLRFPSSPTSWRGSSEISSAWRRLTC